MPVLRRLCVAVCLAPLAVAQAAQSVATVTPQGVFVATTAGPSLPLVGAADTPGAVRWVFPGGTQITSLAAVGDHGALVWLGRSGNNSRFTLAATTEVSPPSAVREFANPAANATIRMQAADRAEYAVTCYATSAGSTIQFLDAHATAPLWTKAVAYDAAIDISADGRYVAIGTRTGTAVVEVYDALYVGPALPIATFTASSTGLRALDLSDDGSTVLIGTQNRNHVFDVATQSEVFQDGSTVSHDAHCINANGSAWGRGGFNPVRAWVKNNGVYNNVLNFSDASLGFAVHTAAGISADGSTFVTAAYDANNNARMRVHCFALTPTSSTRLWSYVSDGTGTLQDMPTSVSITADGSWIAVGHWGDQGNTSPEVLIFARNGNGQPAAGIDSPGSCNEVDFAGDGSFLAAGTKGTHANVFGNGGEGYCYEMAGRDFRMSGTPSIGRTVQFATDGNAGDLVLIGFSGGSVGPIPVPGIGGALLLDPAQIVTTISAGVVPVSGPQLFSLALPPFVAITHSRFYLQAVRGGGAWDFTNALFFPILP